MNMMTPINASPTAEAAPAMTFIEAMANAATAVSIVTTDGAAGRFGMTVSAIASVSAEPPMVLACINRRSPAVDAIEANGVFCVNMLSSEQSALAQCFAGRPETGVPYDFGIADWQTTATGAPGLIGATASFDCLLDASHDAGTHRIVIGRVKSATGCDTSPLAYAQRAFQTLRPLNT